MSSLYNIDRADDIGVIVVATLNAQELCLRLSIVFRHVSAARAGPACVVWWYCQQDAAVPRFLIVQLPPELAPTLIENRAVQAALLRYFLTRLIDRSLGRPGHVAYL